MSSVPVFVTHPAGRYSRPQVSTEVSPQLPFVKNEVEYGIRNELPAKSNSFLLVSTVLRRMPASGQVSGGMPPNDKLSKTALPIPLNFLGLLNISDSNVHNARRTSRLDAKRTTIIVKGNQLVGLNVDTRGNGNVRSKNCRNNIRRLVLDNQKNTLLARVDSRKDARNRASSSNLLVDEFREKRGRNIDIGHN
jgi:hypothetical protein